MAFSKCRGTVLKLDIASTLTAIAQVIGVDPPEEESLDYEVLTLDQTGTGVGREMNGYNDSSGFGAELFFDPALAPHLAIRTNIATPAKTTWQIILANTDASEFDIICASTKLKLGVAARDGLKATLSGNSDGLATFTADPT